jgi:hypothetical protein
MDYYLTAGQGSWIMAPSGLMQCAITLQGCRINRRMLMLISMPTQVMRTTMEDPP